jgi:hypothetical protein
MFPVTLKIISFGRFSATILNNLKSDKLNEIGTVVGPF